MVGLGSMLGTGIFVSIGLAAGITNSSVVLAIMVAALVACCNALSSAQLAAAQPVSGGSYEYGYRLLHPAAGFLAGWLFLMAKSASAATAALGFAGYVLFFSGEPTGSHVHVAVGTIVVFTLVVLAGIRRSSNANLLIVGITVLALLAFSSFGLGDLIRDPGEARAFPLLSSKDHWIAARDFLHATALMFVAFTGYGRLATLAEEVRDPARTIPCAIIVTVALTALLYVLVGVVAVASVGAASLFDTASRNGAPLVHAATAIGPPWLPVLVTIGAGTAMLGVLLNLILGLSRVFLAMARRGDMPRILSRLTPGRSNPAAAILATGCLVAVLALIGNVQATWSFSAFTVLLYYAITNAAALAQPAAERLYPRWVSAVGLVCCLTLAVWVETTVLLWGCFFVLGALGIFLLRRLIGERESLT